MYKFYLSKDGKVGFEKAARWAFFPSEHGYDSSSISDVPEYYESVRNAIANACSNHTIDYFNYHIVKQLASLALSIMKYEKMADFDVIQFVAEVGCDGDNVRDEHV